MQYYVPTILFKHAKTEILKQSHAVVKTKCVIFVYGHLKIYNNVVHFDGGKNCRFCCGASQKHHIFNIHD